ncbi:hypothetical protein [Streptomyces mirabilis]|uniref:hypothetical protein n=1 Tax=Streptomyces mirabilis TaxID=68239 RepID=UPI00225B2A3A|nr:hypothetical protein [Streptomyces mirabilis]MCX4420223.1 hypothetical protein [Streptomyces mirabilis]
MSKPKVWKAMCRVCGIRPLAMPRVDYCFTCWPGGPVTPPPCLRCGSRRHYYASGLCARCHPSAVPPVDSCRNCLAWGASRHLRWLCKGCNSWCRKYDVSGPCRVCGLDSVLDLDGVCRLCRKQAALVRGARAQATLQETNRDGQQLFIADLFSGHGPPMGRRPRQAPVPVEPLVPVTYRQLVLFEMARTLRHRGMHGLARAADPRLAAVLDVFTRERAARYGWTHETIWNVRTGVNIMLGFQDTPGVAITASDVAVLSEVNLPIRRVLEVLDDAGMLEDDRVPAVASWFDRQITGLPAPMSEEVRAWFRIMFEGSTTTPRQRPRTVTTIKLYLRWMHPALAAWAQDGKTSLREISVQDVRDVLPDDPLRRDQTGQALRSLFRLLKARRIVFRNPLSQVKTDKHSPGTPMSLSPDDIKDALNSPDPGRALVTALIAFHGVTSLQLQHLQLTDIRDGRLTLGDRSIPLAEPVRRRLSTYLDYRALHWPNTANPHLLIHFRTANNDGHVGYRWIFLLLGPKLNTRKLRTDRYLDEARATNGDTRRLTDLFGLSFQAAQRYTDTITAPPTPNTASPTRSSGTRGS